MSQHLHINSLLNFGKRQQQQNLAAQEDGEQEQRSEISSRPSSSSSAIRHGQMQPPAILRYPTTQIPPLLNPRPSETHAVRDQSVYMMHDYRYWPYARQLEPQHPQAALPHMAGGPYGTPQFPQPGDSYIDLRQRCMPWHRQRRTRACQNCHVKKVKCEGNGGRCFNCIRANIECKWIPMKKRGPKPKSKPTTTESSPISSHSSAVQLPRISELHEELQQNSSPATAPQSKPSLGLGIASYSQNSRATSATTATASPHIDGRNESLSRNRVSRSVSASIDSGAVADDFYRILTNDGTGKLGSEWIENTLRRFYSEEVSKETRNTVIYYFEYFYSICPIFHPALFIRRVVEGRVDQILIDSMRASAARIINRHTGSNIDVDALIEGINLKLLSYLDKPNFDYVRAVVIMASLNGGECRFMMYNMLTCLASSLVTRLGWHMLDARPIDPNITWKEWISIELKRRTYYVVFQIDGYLAMLSDRSMSIPMKRALVRISGSGTWWDHLANPRITSEMPCRFDINMSREEIIKTGSLTHSFVDLCALTTIVSRVNDLLWDLKRCLPTYPNKEEFTPNIKHLEGYDVDKFNVTLPIQSLFDIDEFGYVHELIVEWRRNLVNAADMNDITEFSRPFPKFGDHTHRTYQMRLRYFCLYTYSVPVIHYLHFANRPSYFETTSPNKVFVDAPDIVSPLSSDAPENKAIHEILATVFTERLNRGLLAYDIISESWKICVEAVYDLVRHLDRNRDIPLERYDQVMPFCLLTSMTVLIRNAHICKHFIESSTANDNIKGMDSIREDLAQSTMALRRLWTLLCDLSQVWRVEGIGYLMRVMQVEEVVNAADLLSGLSL
ncbi:hypothetical protein IWW36_000368 [Coemansia brasiliensis]|uniref:Zn(2)-C6 fungal-type domain-containing protein n=1 Tax=Coemansia brasiliensis TaxID=2650707 RepID=A0A9W8IHC8_9FUNG|nr:hypothetical protein IWW36_000368 [Coemansia brasiliensis]